MGTRADFYVGRGEQAEWLGSVAYDGYPSGIDEQLLKCQSEQTFRKAVRALLAEREDRTLPEDGWPWPWEDSRTTDYAYAFDAGAVHASYFGRPWFDATKEVDDVDELEGPAPVFPDMSKGKQRERFGPHSGIMLLGFKK